MYPRSRAKGGLQGGGQGDGDSVPGLTQPSAPPLVSTGVASSNTTIRHRKHPSTMLRSQGAHYSSTAFDLQLSLHASPQPPPPMLHMPPGVYGEPMCDICGSRSPPPLPHFFSGDVHHPGGSACGNIRHRTVSSSYDQQQQPLLPPRLKCHERDCIAGSTAGATRSGSMQLGVPASLASTSPKEKVSYSRRNQKKSSAAMMPIGGAAVGTDATSGPPTGVAGPGDAAFRPPPIYGETYLNSITDAAGSTANNLSDVSLNCNTAPTSGTQVATAKAVRKSSCTTPSVTGALEGGIAILGVDSPSLPSNTKGGEPIVQVRRTGSSSPTAAPVRAAASGVTSREAMARKSAPLIAASAPRSPLVNPPSLPQQEVQQQHFPASRQRSVERSKRTLRPTSNHREEGGASCRGDFPAPEGSASIADAEFTERSRCSSGKGVGKSTMVQAEERYRHLYEEFRKGSRLRAKLLEESERMKREQAVLCEELTYYRHKTASAAEEREALLADYRDDLHDALRLAHVLAADVAAEQRSGGDASQSASPTEGVGHSVPVPSAQEALDAAITRISASNVAETVTAPTTRPATGVLAASSAPLESVHFSESPLSCIAKCLRLRYGRWMPMPAADSRQLIMDKEPGDPSLSERYRSGTGPQHLQSVLLRDEMRDVHCSTHAAVSAYITSLDYGFAPVFSQCSCPPEGSQEPPYQQQHFKSEYCGLHFHVDVPRLHAHTVPAGFDTGDTDKDGARGESRLEHEVFPQSKGEHEQPTPDLASESKHMGPSLM
ncbi:hypothetical protein LSCM1_06250 [Leishmania martiniquensis]|uniref:Uncharacterized protein n=1 Tax=Leishmania martiniquensis TaxID=1580590 RepID=A0A836KN60_9TRYP|nr:hypothetical protein LSCM1_06250 [Leishmania martiniquensis]